jgi:hypothetical protein
MKFRLLIVAVVFLASCAPWQPLGSSYEPKNGDNYNRDIYECEREATLAGAGNKQRVFDDCMKARGYKQK